MQFKTVTKGNFDLAKWAHAVHVPSFEEYMKVGDLSVFDFGRYIHVYGTEGYKRRL